MNEYTVDFYNEAYSVGGTSGIYFLDPEKSVYYTTWLKILENVNINDRICDLGCGPGQFIELALRLGYTTVLGVDFSKVALNIAKKRKIKNTELILGNLNDVNLLNSINNKYDIAIIGEVLEHIKDDVLLLSRLGKGKPVIFTVPNFWAESHIRWFNNKKEIITRYKKVVSIEKIDIIKVYPKRKTLIYIAKGIIKY